MMYSKKAVSSTVERESRGNTTQHLDFAICRLQSTHDAYDWLSKVEMFTYHRVSEIERNVVDLRLNPWRAL